MYTNHTMKNRVFLIFFLILIPAGISHTGASGISGESPGTTLIALYMVGSDLESEYNLGTREIDEICSGLGESQGAVDLVIAYGGSKKKGWSGMTIASLDDLKKDRQNGIIGDENLWQDHIDTADMGGEPALDTFFRYLKTLPPHSRNILIFWDHGASYEGLCFDENHEDDPLTLQEVKTSLSHGGISWDLIGMDACLMGSYEVAEAVAGSADLLLVSEEVVPGHGWDYQRPLKRLSMDPDMQVEELGREIINAYMENPSHEPSKKTLSLINLTRFGTIEKEAGDLGIYLSDRITQWETYKAIGDSWYQSQRFGYDLENDRECTVDFIDFTRFLASGIPDGADRIRRVDQAISDAIVYQREDGSRPGAHGLSTLSPRNRPASEVIASEAEVPGDTGWKQFIEKYLTYVSTDATKPVIIDIGGGRYRISDDMGIQSVSVDTSWKYDLNTSYYFDLKQEPVYPDSDGLYTPNPDDQTFYVMDTGTGMREVLYHKYLGNQSGTEYYVGEVMITRGNKTRNGVVTIMKNETGRIDYNLVTYIRRDNGEILFSKEPLTIRAGDRITPMIKEFIFEERKTINHLIPWNPVNITGQMAIVRDRLPYGAYYPVLFAQDHNGNFALADIGKLRLPNSVTVLP